MLYQSANRDEDVFDAPDELRLDRDPNPHLGFGIGPHFCLGANLARNEIKTVFQELLPAPARHHGARRRHASRGATPPSCSPSSTCPTGLHRPSSRPLTGAAR